MGSKFLQKAGLIFIALALFSTVSAASCDNVSVSLSNPQELNYTYSINIPLEYTIVNATNCWVIIDSEKYYENLTITCSNEPYQFDVDYDGNYTLTFYAVNSTDTGICNSSVDFIIDRTSEFEENKLTLVAIVIGILIIIGFYTIHFSSYLDGKFKVMCLVLSFLFVYTAIAIALLAAREYVKVPSILSSLDVMFRATVYIAVLISSLILTYFIFNIIHNTVEKNKKRRSGGDSEEWDNDYYS